MSFRAGPFRVASRLTGCQPSIRLGVLLAALGIMTAGCSDKSYTMLLTFEPPELANRIDQIRITLIDNCSVVPATPGANAMIVRDQFLITRTAVLSRALDFDPGLYGFYAIGIDGVEVEDDCRIAAGCREHTIVANGSGLLDVELGPIPPLFCPPVSDAGVDAGHDAGKDAGIEDAGEEPDASKCEGASCGIGALQVALGTTHTCALRNDRRVVCWGSNAYGQVGSGSVGGNVARPTLAAGLMNAQEISAGGATNCALRENHTVVCWGDNQFGQLGIDPFMLPMYPTPTPNPQLANVRTIGIAPQHACAILESGRVRCWGRNEDGALGNNMTGGVVFAAQVVPTVMNAVQVEGGIHFTCARVENGAMYCWGRNDRGQIGNGSYTRSLTPVLVEGIDDAVTFAAGSQHVCAIREGGEIVCWGDGTYEQLLNGAGMRSPTPLTVGIDNAEVMGSGKNHVCALLDDDTVSCWGGTNASGELGNGMTTNVVSPPFTVVGLDDVTGLARSYGEAHMCAIRASGRVACWGDNRSGQLGNGTVSATPSAAPVQVRDL